MTTTCKICGEWIDVDNKACKCNSVFATPQDELSAIAWDVINNLQNPDDKEKIKKDFAKFLEDLK